MTTTIAFSTKTLDWKTRYSFEPNQYMTSGNEMVSFPISSSLSAWQHDTGTYSRFYGVNTKPFVSVVSNEDPSATKIYESMSLEGDINPSKVDFHTRTAETQKSTATSFVEKEGKVYTDVPKNSLNIDHALAFIGETTVGSLRKVRDGQSSSISLISRPVRIPNGSIIIQPAPGERITSYISSIYGSSISSQELQSLLNSVENVKLSLTVIGAILTGSDGWIESTQTAIYSPSALPFAKSYDPYTNSIEVTSLNIAQTISDAFEAMNVSETTIDDLPITLYSYNNPEINGDDMRGDFLKVDMEFPAGGYFEVYAVNIDQHKTKLDHSLGQNN